MRLLAILALAAAAAAKAADPGLIVCARFGEDGRPGAVSTEAPYQLCRDNYCYTVWREDPTNGSVAIIGQGCWDTSGRPNECDRAECIADNKPPKASNQTKFCCCAQDKCNGNFTNAYVPSDEDDAPPPPAPRQQANPLVWAGISFGFIFVALVLVVVFYYSWRFMPGKGDLEGGALQPLPPPSDYSLDKLKLLNIIGQGRYGCVWRGLIDDEEVAVKVFAAHHRAHFLNEHEMYQVSGENAALLKCHGGGEHAAAVGAPADFMLLLSLELGCLQEHLKAHTLDLATLSRMSLGVARGLAHLHSDLGKPCIAHRDVNTRNILVRADLSCCLCDLGLAVVPRRAENKSISEAGTLRYMAPEVLEGAVNLRDCESALKQIDVYALGLVLWELGARCVDMQAGEPPPYAPPFLAEAGDSPTLEQMQALISRRKARPLWPAAWRDTAGARLLCETAEDCWDQDAEARLTALCVAERLHELPTLRGRVLHSMVHPPASPTPLINNNHLHDRQDASVGTIETLLSPSEEHCKNSNQFAACVAPLQPYQGRNPCLERNLLSGSSDSLLIDKSSKHCTTSDDQNLIANDFLNYQMNYRAMPIPYVQNAVHGSPKLHNSSVVACAKPPRLWRGLRQLFGGRARAAPKTTQVRLSTKRVNDGRNGGVRPVTLPVRGARLEVCAPTGDSRSSTSLERFGEVFASTGDLSRLKDPALRVKTPGDVPASVRRTRGRAAKESAARFSLYDDRMMGRGQWGSAPDLEPPMAVRAAQFGDVQDRDSVSSF